MLAIQKSMVDQHQTIADVMTMFVANDTSADGYLSFVEFVTLLNNHQLHPSTAQARKVFQFFDLENDGMVSYISFLRVVFPEYDVESMSAHEIDKQKRASIRAIEDTASGRSSPGAGVAQAVRASVRMSRGSVDASPGLFGRRGSRQLQTAQTNNEDPHDSHGSAQVAQLVAAQAAQTAQVMAALGQLGTKLDAMGKRLERLEDRVSAAVESAPTDPPAPSPPSTNWFSLSNRMTA